MYCNYKLFRPMLCPRVRLASGNELGNSLGPLFESRPEMRANPMLYLGRDRVGINILRTGNLMSSECPSRTVISVPLPGRVETCSRPLSCL